MYSVCVRKGGGPSAFNNAMQGKQYILIVESESSIHVSTFYMHTHSYLQDMTFDLNHELTEKPPHTLNKIHTRSGL